MQLAPAWIKEVREGRNATRRGLLDSEQGCALTNCHSRLCSNAPAEGLREIHVFLAGLR
jgi:hypothetical protein